MARGVDVPARFHAAAVLEDEAGDAVALALDRRDRRLLVHRGAERGRVVEQDLVVHRAVDLQRGLEALARELRGARLVLELVQRQELEVPQPGVLPQR